MITGKLFENLKKNDWKIIGNVEKLFCNENRRKMDGKLRIIGTWKG